MSQDEDLNYNIFALNTGGPNNSQLEYGYMKEASLKLIEGKFYEKQLIDLLNDLAKAKQEKNKEKETTLEWYDTFGEAKHV